MSFIKAFRGLRPRAELIADIIAPPYDVINRQQAKQLAEAKPYSFLHISKPEIDLASDIDAYAPAVYQQAAINFAKLQSEQILQQDKQESFYLYRLTQNQHQQLGVFVALACDAYEDGRIKRHEFTKPEKEDDRLEHLNHLHAHTSPVLLTHENQAELEQLLQNLSQVQAPCYDVLDQQQVRHQLWQISETQACAQLGQALNRLPHLYVADGHHRTAAASRHAKRLGGEHYFLAALFASDQLKLLGYHRLVKDLNGLNPEQLLKQLEHSFSMKPCPLQTPVTANHFILYVAGHSYELQLKHAILEKLTRVDRLDATIVYQYILKNSLNITDPRRDPRLSYCGGQQSLGNIQQAVDNGEQALAILMPPLNIEAMLNVADHHQILPPKSTWFEPKLADGLICLVDP